jgi:urease accessory protein
VLSDVARFTAAQPPLAVMDDESYILLLLSDSNLPTGSFVASSGLESYVKHGFGQGDNDTIVNFTRDSLTNYARSALPFVSDAYEVVKDIDGQGGDDILEKIKALDAYYDVMTLNHVTKRASKSQGVALLNLYSKGFSRPPSLSSVNQQTRETRFSALIDQFKFLVRREDTPGHLPICWGVLTAILGLTLGMSKVRYLI